MTSSKHVSQGPLKPQLSCIRLCATFSMIYGLLYLFSAALLLTGALSQADEATRTAAFLLLITAAIPCGLMLLMAIFGFRAARDRHRIMPFCVASVMYAGLMLISMVLSGFTGVTQAIAEGATGIISLAYNVLTVVAAVMALQVVAYNKRDAASAAAGSSVAGAATALEDGGDGAPEGRDALADHDASAACAAPDAAASPRAAAEPESLPAAGATAERDGAAEHSGVAGHNGAAEGSDGDATKHAAK